MSQEQMKMMVAKAALDFVVDKTVIGVGTGSTTNYFIDYLATYKGRIEGAVASSQATAERLQAHGIPVFDLNSVSEVSVYIDGADEANQHRQLIKGGGGALTREKIIAAAAKKFICIVDKSKLVNVLGKFPLPVEVIPMARSYVGRQILKMGGNPEYRSGFVTDNGNIILDIYHLDLVNPIDIENKLNQITGVVCNGLFANRMADKVLVSDGKKVTEF